jgi:hypothetical protein
VPTNPKPLKYKTLEDMATPENRAFRGH